MVKKLPYYAADRWCRLVDRNLYRSEQSMYGCATLDGRYPTFSEFCEFVSNEARVACGPCKIQKTEETASGGPKLKEKGNRWTQSRSLATSASETKPESKEKATPQEDPPSATKEREITCFFCTGPHLISKCMTFLKKDVKEKKDFAMKKGLCFGCLRRNHIYRDCRSRNPALMSDAKHDQVKHDQDSSNTEVARADCKRVSTQGHAEKKGVLHSMIVPVVLSHIDSPEIEVETYALLDTMADACFITEDLLRRLSVRSKPMDLQVVTLVEKVVQKTEVASGLLVRATREATTLQLPKVYGQKEISTDRELIPRPETVRRWPHLQQVAEKLEPYRDDLDVGLLIGSNCSAAILPKEVISREESEPYGVRTCLGWSVVGWVETPEDQPEHQPRFAHKTTTRELTPSEVKQMFEVEFQDRAAEGKLSIEDRRFIEVVETGIHKRQDGHYEMPLPLKEDIGLPNNRVMAEKRLSQLRRKMEKNSQFRKDYITSMEDVLMKKYAEPIPETEREGPKGRTWYIPHHGVYHPKKPGKLRVVYDCSAEYSGAVLNRNLLQGPDLTNNLTGILCRFREEKIAITCDIEGMFLQVGVDAACRDLLRFLWWQDGEIDGPVKDYRMAVHLFGATSSPACANYALKTTADEQEADFGKEAADFVRRNFYVDDGLQSLKSVPEALALIEASRKMCHAGGFNLHKFVCNDRTVVEQMPEEIRAKGIQNLDLRHEALPVERTLGVEWCVQSDSFQFRVRLDDKPVTRRGILSSVSSIYDPLGLVSPFLLNGKKILQDVVREGRDWDDPVSEDCAARWDRWRSDLLKLAELKIPRCYKPEAMTTVHVELHHFSDASEGGYGACSYLRLVGGNGEISTSLVLSKARVTPTKPVTIPRLELTAAVTTVNLAGFLASELTYQDIQNYYWTDSKVVLGYIKNKSRRFHVFVANRIQRIHEKSSSEDWHHIPTAHNPADLTSRGMTGDDLMKSQLWWGGPPFLSKNSPLPLLEEPASLAEDDPEVKKTVVHSAVTREKADLLKRLERFSDWYRAKRAVALCKRYIQRLRQRCQDHKKSQQELHPLTVTDVQEAEKTILRAVQLSGLPRCCTELGAHSEERDASKKRREQMKKDTNLYRLDPYVGTDGLIRVGGRIRRANLPRDVAHPIILPADAHVTRLIVKSQHEKTGHSGRTTTLGELRTAGYWVLRGTTLIRSIIDKCVTCRKMRSPTTAQKMADLPEDRMQEAPPFTYTGVDYFGPFYVKEGRSEKKRWGCLFTCLVSRAVHIEVTNSMSTDSFLSAYRRFTGRRGAVRMLRSDRGTNFVGAKNELDAALAEMDQEQIHREMLRDECDWVEFKMNPPHASHMGGVWERMIRSIRTVFNSLLSQHSILLDDELLRTLMVEAEAIVNSRPITCTEAELEPLSPANLLTLKTRVIMPPPGRFVKQDLYCRKRWRRVQYLANEFWARWRKEYLHTLQGRQKWTSAKDNLQDGDIVLLTDGNTPRCQWSKGIVVQAQASDDGLVRKVLLRTTTGQYERPVHKLVLLLRPGVPSGEPCMEAE